MDVYLMQHGEALPAEADPQRPLSADGAAHVRAVAARAAVCGVQVDRIVHSGKLRAEQSAQVLAEGLRCETVERLLGLAPGDPPDAAIAAIGEPSRPGSIVIVGHLPALDRLASQLVTGDPAAHVVAFRNAALVKLVPAPPESAAPFSVSWILTPVLAM
ncbi:MAG: phosphohistidine phosphatase SixA [Candidatus Nanopelagicales bacterium]|jgi:phosphohistidine phosphatase|nr:phosphohistidine phosphatase SixA [Candidatus Nanopelagicales bacterium]